MVRGVMSNSRESSEIVQVGDMRGLAVYVNVNYDGPEQSSSLSRAFMNPNEHQLQYPWGDVQPEPGRAQQVAEGVKWIRMPLPFALDHINLWLLRDEIDGRQGWTVVDCGISRDPVKTLWEQVFANELEGLPVLRVLVTHMHPAHVGLAHWLRSEEQTSELQSLMSTPYAY